MNDYQDDLVAEYYKFRPPYHPKFIAELVNQVKLQKTDIPLDLLCGRGEIARHLTKYCDNVVGVDGSQQMLERAEDAGNIKFLLGDVNHGDFINLFNGQKFNHCFVGRAIHWIEDNSLIKIKESILSNPTWFVTMQGGYSKINPWMQAYNEVLKKYPDSSNGVDWISRKKVLSAGFTYKKELSSVFQIKVDIDFLFGTALSYSMRAHILKSYENEIKNLLRTALNPYIGADGFLIAKISNSAFIYRSD